MFTNTTQSSSTLVSQFPSCVISFSPDKNYAKYNNICNERFGGLKSYPCKNLQDGTNVEWSEIKVANFSEVEQKNIFEIAKMLKDLKNPNISEIYDCWEKIDDNGEKFFVFITEPITSGSLHDYIKRFKQININVIKLWCRQILEALNFLHSQQPQIVHGKLSCNNIFITEKSGKVKIDVLGFLAAAVRHPEFVAPEMQQKKEYDEKVDIYAFGMCLLLMATSEIPYFGCAKSVTDIFDKVSQGIKPACFHRIPPAYPEVAELVEKCIALRKEDRPTVKELLGNEFFLSNSSSKPQPVGDATTETTVNVSVKEAKATTEATISSILNSAEIAETLVKRLPDIAYPSTNVENSKTEKYNSEKDGETIRKETEETEAKIAEIEGHSTPMTLSEGQQQTTNPSTNFNSLGLFLVQNAERIREINELASQHAQATLDQQTPCTLMDSVCPDCKTTSIKTMLRNYKTGVISCIVCSNRSHGSSHTEKLKEAKQQSLKSVDQLIKQKSVSQNSNVLEEVKIASEDNTTITPAATPTSASSAEETASSSGWAALKAELSEIYGNKPDITFSSKTAPTTNKLFTCNPCLSSNIPFPNSSITPFPCPPGEDIFSWNPFRPQPSASTASAAQMSICPNCKTASKALSCNYQTAQQICSTSGSGICKMPSITAITKPSSPIPPNEDIWNPFKLQFSGSSVGYPGRQLVCPICKIPSKTLPIDFKTGKHICRSCLYEKSKIPAVESRRHGGNILPHSSLFSKQQPTTPSGFKSLLIPSKPASYVVAEFIPAKSLSDATCERCKTSSTIIWIRNVYGETFCFPCSSLWMPKVSVTSGNPTGMSPKFICLTCKFSGYNITFKFLNNNEIICNSCWQNRDMQNVSTVMLPSEAKPNNDLSNPAQASVRPTLHSPYCSKCKMNSKHSLFKWFASNNNNELLCNLCWIGNQQSSKLPPKEEYFAKLKNRRRSLSSVFYPPVINSSLLKSTSKHGTEKENLGCLNCKQILLKIEGTELSNEEFVCRRCKLVFTFIDGKVIIKNEEENPAQEYYYYSYCIECHAGLYENEGVDTEKGFICKCCSLACKEPQSKEPSVQKGITKVVEKDEAFVDPLGVATKQQQQMRRAYEKLSAEKEVTTANEAEKAKETSSTCSSSTTTLTDAFTSQKYSDVVFLTNDSKKVFAHRCILYSFSDIFTALFDQKPEISCEIEVDFSQDAVIRALQFCYGNPAPIKNWERTLIKFAESYEIKGLKEACIKSLEDKSLTFDIVCYYIIPAFEYDIAPLKEKCIKFIGKFKKEIGAQELSKLPVDILVSTVLSI